MNPLLDKKELKKFAAELPVASLKEVIELLNESLEKRHNEEQTLKELENLAKSKGFSLQQLGLVNTSVIHSEDTEHADRRPKKPKLKAVNLQSQYFYIEDNALHLLKTHTMKQSLKSRGISVLPHFHFEKTHKKEMDDLITEANIASVHSYNSKVDEWNKWAAEHCEEILEKK